MKHFYALLPILLTLLLLAACGDDTPAESTGSVSEATKLPPAQPSPTAEPPKPTPEPTPQPSPQPTALAADLPADSASGWGESGTTAQSACDHPYFPLREGYTFTMSSADGQDMRWEVVSVEGDMDQATAEMQMSWDELAFSYSWTCSAAEGLVSYEFSNPSLGAFAPEAQIVVSGGSGSFLPPVEELQPGATWEASFDSELDITQVEGGEEIEVSGTIHTTQSNEVVSDEAAAFDGREIPAILIQQDLGLSMAMTVMGTTVENDMDMAGEVRFGYGIGMLEQTSYSEFGDFTSTLKEVTVP